MKLVKISDLNEEERKKAFEEQQKRLEENRRISEQNRINANNQFNELINRTGAFDTNNHTTNFYNITNAMKSSGASKQSINAFKKNNHVSLWDSVLDIMNGTGKTVENTWLGLNNGIKSFQQTLGKRMTETQQNRVDFWNEENKRMLEQRAKTHLEEENQIKQAINNPLVTGEQLREGEKKTSEKIQNKKEENLQKINKNIEEIDNPVMKKIAEISPSIGQMAPAFATGGIGAIYMAGSATGQYYDDAKQGGMNDEEAKTYSGIMGLMEGATEMIGINNLSKAGKGLKELVKGTGKEVAKETAEKVSKSTVKEVLKDYGIGIADNMIQEALIDPIQEFTAQTVAGKDKAQWNGLGNRMLQDAINGGLVGAILGGANLGIQSCTGLVQKYNSNQEVTPEEFKTAVKDASKELDTGEMIKQNVQQEVGKYSKQNESNIIDTKGMTFEESASANNIDINNETIKTVSQALSNRDIAGRFDSSYFKNSNENAIWRTYKDEEGKIKREVIFNPNGDSQNTMQQISIHELTHDLVGTKEYEELKNLVLDKNKTRQGYEEARQSLESTYSQVYDSNSENFKSLVDDEEVADTLAQKLGDQDFINSLNVEKPNVFKRIYNWVVDKVNKITGNKFEKVYWEDIKNKFESAYRQDYQGKSNSNRFSIQTDSNGNKFVKIDTNQDIFKGKALSEQTKIAKQYILDKFRDKGLKLDNENVKITSKTANEYTHPKKQLPYKTKQAKIKASTELDNMLNISDYQYSSNDDGRHRFAKDGWDYYKTVFEVDGVKFEGLVNVAKSGDKKTFYDVTNIKRISQNRSALDKSFSTSLTNSNNSIPTSNDNVNTINNNSMQESENNSGSFNLAKNNTLNLPTKQLTEKQRQNRLEYLKNIDTSNMKLLEKSKIKSEIRALENGYNSVEEMRQADNIKEKKAIQEYNNKNKTKEDSNKSSFNLSENYSAKEKQLDIIQKTNPMLDDYHTGIRAVGDIKTFKEAYDIAKREASDGGWDEYASYPDITNDMIENSLKTGEITVYSSNDIKNGIFVTPSYEQALEYAGNDASKVKSKNVKVDDVAWINLDEGQYAKVNNTKASEKQEVNKIKQDGSITMTYVRNANTNTQNYGSRYGQNIEPAGEYMSMDTMQGKYKIPGFEYGSIDFKKPLILDHKDTTANGWKKDLSKKYGGLTGKKLSEAIKKDGYDAIMTKDEEGNFIEVVNINGKKKNNLNTRASIGESGAWQSFLENQIGPTGKGKTVEELRLPTKENVEIIKNRKKINQYNKEKLEKVGITKDNDIITNKEDSSEKVDEEKIAKILEEVPTKEKEKSRALAIFKANVFDKGIVFEELSRKTKNRELQGKWDYTLTANTRGQNAIGMPRYEFDSKTKTQKLVSKSLESIREEVGENKTEFNNYMYHQLNIDRMTLEKRFGGDTGINYERKNPIKNKPVFSNEVTAEMSQEIVDKYEQSNPEFKEWAKDVYDFLDANTQELVKSGVISEDTRQVFKEMYPHYVPIARVNNKGNAIAVPLDTGRTGVNTPIKRAKGGNQDILPLFETMANRTLQTYRASARNSFGVELLHTLQTPQTAENVDVDNVMEEITNSENEELLKKGNKTAPPTFTVFENGEKVTFEISKDMYDALKPVGEGLSYKSKVLNKISNFRRGVLTEYNPVFMITNSLKDIQDVVINSQHIAKTISKLPEAYNQILKKGYWYNEYIQNGGEQNSYFNANDGSFENDKKSKLAKNVATFPLRAISKVNNIIEMSPRLAEYIASREKGISIETSMLDASRVTTNFKAGGNVTKFLNRNGATFLNASVQGAMQQIRNIQEAKVKGLKGWTVLACKYAVAGLPVILLNNILWGDDEDYEELQDYVKDNYYCVAKYGNGKFIRIPKGRTTATIQKIVSNVNEYLTEDKEINIDNLAKDFWEDLQFTMDNLAPNNPIDNNIISPIIQVVTNISWYGEDIVPSRLQDKPKEEQYDETTDKFSKWLGEKLKISPYKINYLLDQYGGGISDVVLPALTPQAENNMMEDKFTTDSVMKSKYPGDFFEKSDEINVKANSDKATDLDKVKSKYLTQTSEEMNKLYKEKRKIQNSDVEDSIKEDKLKEVQKEINKLARKGMEEVEKVEIKGITAKVGNESYYKYHGEWTTLSDEEKEKGLDKVIKSYADYKNKVYETTKQKQDIGELKEDEQLKEKDKLKILEDSKYSDADKQKIYKETIGNDDDLYKQVLQTSNININEYLKYKQQEFESDKEDDGTLSGKTIKNSKKQKVYDYVKKMKINDTQRLLILGKQFKLNRNEQQMLYSYINDIPRLTKEERLEIFKMYSNNFEIYKSGKLSFK